jgi:hypothetical protein
MPAVRADTGAVCAATQEAQGACRALCMRRSKWQEGNGGALGAVGLASATLC